MKLSVAEAVPDGALLICDSERGLLRLDKPHGELEVLVDEVDGERLNFASNVVADTDGTIYFSASTRRYPFEHYMGDIYEHSGTGRLLRTMTDRGVVAILDPRLLTKRYGTFLRASLPPFWTTTNPEVVRAALRRLAAADRAPEGG